MFLGFRLLFMGSRGVCLSFVVVVVEDVDDTRSYESKQGDGVIVYSYERVLPFLPAEGE